MATDIDDICGNNTLAIAGTGPILLGTALPYHRSITTALANNAVRTFYATDPSGSNYMLFVGTYITASNHIVVGTVKQGSNGTSPVSWGGAILKILLVASSDEIRNPKKLTQLFDANSTKPIVIIAIGDSTNLGIGGTSAGIQTANNRVFIYASDGALPRQDPATRLAWRNVDPHATVVLDAGDYSTAPPYWGLLRGDRITAAFALANRVQQRTEQDVYLITVGRAGTFSQNWSPESGGGADFNSLNAHTRSALDSIPGYSAGEAFAHIVLIQLGTNNANLAYPASGYVTNIKEIIKHFNNPAQNWAKEANTQYFVCGPVSDVLPFWMGFDYLERQTSDYLRVISGEDLAIVPDGAHFLPAGSNAQGLIAADAALSGTSPTGYSSKDGYVERRGSSVATLSLKYDLYYSTFGTVGAPVTTPLPSIVQGSHSVTLWVNIAGLFGCAFPTVYDNTATLTNGFTGFSIANSAMHTIVRNGNTYQNEATVAQGLSAVRIAEAVETYNANAQNVTASNLGPFFTNPVFKGTGGTLTVTQYASYRSNCTINAGATVNAKHGFIVELPTVGASGVFIRQSGFTSPDLSAGAAATKATHNTQCLLGTTTIPDGQWASYSVSALPSKTSGGSIIKYKVCGLTEVYTIAITDNLIIIGTSATAFTGTLTLPSRDAMETSGYGALGLDGWTVTIKNGHASGTTTIVAGANTTILTSAVIAAAVNTTYTYDAANDRWV